MGLGVFASGDLITMAASSIMQSRSFLITEGGNSQKLCSCRLKVVADCLFELHDMKCFFSNFNPCKLKGLSLYHHVHRGHRMCLDVCMFGLHRRS